MTGPNVTGPASVPSYSVDSPWVAMWWTHPTNWSMSPRRPSVGRSTTRIAIPATRAARMISVLERAQPPDDRSDAAGPPVPFGLPVDIAERTERRSVGPHRITHLAVAVEQPLDLAFVDRDAGDLAFDLIRDVGERGIDADVGWQVNEGVRTQLLERPEVVPERVREVLVEDDRARVFGTRHDPP